MQPYYPPFQPPHHVTLNWVKCEQDQWCNFLTLNLDHPHFSALLGVYIIWHGGQNAATVYVGQGAIADRLRAHRDEQEILRFSPVGLFVTWARANANQLNGIEAYLAQTLHPLVGHQFPFATPITVNLPW
jgi:hypothetical protein